MLDFTGIPLRRPHGCIGLVRSWLICVTRLEKSAMHAREMMNLVKGLLLWLVAVCCHQVHANGKTECQRGLIQCLLPPRMDETAHRNGRSLHLCTCEALEKPEQGIALDGQ